MRCEEVSENLSSYIDGEVKDKMEKNISAHLKKCERCKKEAYELRLIKTEARSLSPIEPPDWIWSNIKNTIWRQRLFKRVFAIASAACLAIVIVGSLFFIRTSQKRAKTDIAFERLKTLDEAIEECRESLRVNPNARVRKTLYNMYKEQVETINLICSEGRE